MVKNGSTEATYAYDLQNQLVSETVGGNTYAYNYDTVGNLMSVQKNGTTIKSYTYGDSAWADLLTAFTVNGVTGSITYDNVGNPLTYYNGTSYTMTWTPERRLATLTGGGKTVSYAYDMDGIRTSKTVNGTTTSYTTVSGQVVRETTGSSVIDFAYEDTGAPYAMRYNGSIYYYLLNLQGDVVGLVDASGNTVASYSYDAWGNVLSATGSLAAINPLRYRGYYYDSETALYYVQSRYYDPMVGRWINADTTDVLSLPYYHPGQYNLFSYCNNNPVNDRDDDGQLSWLAKIAIGAAAIAVGVGVTVLTGGAALPALVAGVKAACVAGAISAGTSVAKTVVRSVASGDSFSTVVQKSTKSAVDGFADGFMAGGIAAGASQVASGGFKIAAKLGAKTGKSGGIKLGNTKILSPDAVWQKNNGGTLLKIGNTFRIDVGSNTLLHMHIPKVSSHIQIGTIGAGIYGGFK